MDVIYCFQQPPFRPTLNTQFLHILLKEERKKKSRTFKHPKDIQLVVEGAEGKRMKMFIAKKRKGYARKSSITNHNLFVIKFLHRHSRFHFGKEKLFKFFN